jgi:hypothetical protein
MSRQGTADRIVVGDDQTAQTMLVGRFEKLGNVGDAIGGIIRVAMKINFQ